MSKDSWQLKFLRSLISHHHINSSIKINQVIEMLQSTLHLKTKI